MKKWTIHWLSASGSLESHRTAITEAFQSAYETLEPLVQMPIMDVLVQRVRGRAISEVGISGRAYRPSLFTMSCDPDNPNFANSLLDGALTRQIVHEVHHCLRMAGRGYGTTLGEALVSEGHAGRFVRHALRSHPEPWESAVTTSELRVLAAKRSTLAETRYDHANWFFGRGSLPRWVGYTLGYEIVGDWLNTMHAETIDWINVPADIPIEAAIKSGLISPY